MVWIFPKSLKRLFYFLFAEVSLLAYEVPPFPSPNCYYIQPICHMRKNGCDMYSTNRNITSIWVSWAVYIFRKYEAINFSLVQAPNEEQIISQSWNKPLNEKFTQTHATGSLDHPPWAPSSVGYVGIGWIGLEKSQSRTGEDNATRKSHAHVPSFDYVCTNYIVFQNNYYYYLEWFSITTTRSIWT